MQLTCGKIVTPCGACNLFSSPHRVLHIDVAAGTAWGIALPRFRENGHVVGYVTRPVAWPLDTVTDLLETGRIVQGEFRAPGFWAMTDDEYISVDLSDGEQRRRNALRLKRDASWATIEPIVSGASLLELLTARSIRGLIAKRAKECGLTPVTVYRLLHLYWAHGSVLNGLYPLTHRCGAKGKDRQSRKPMGRPPSLLKTGAAIDSRFVMSSIDKTRCAVAFAQVGKGCPARTALARMYYAFYSIVDFDEKGVVRVTLFPQNRRPSPSQFRYWGRKLAQSPEFRRRNGLPTIPLKRAHRGGSSRELAQAAGECAQADGTSTDVCLVSLYDRRVKLPPPTRTAVIEQVSGVTLSPFVGWRHPSASTVLQAIYLGAIDKAEFCARFGIDIKRGRWPGLLCRKYLIDNGEARCQEVLDFATQFRIDMEYAPSYAGAAKPDVETSHRSDHKAVDHQLPGSTLGRKRERGQPHPADSALWNYYEYMREYLLYCLEALDREVPERAPTQLIAEGLRPTQINILKWLMDHGQRADIAFDPDQLRAMTLPTFDAVIQYNGVVLKYPDSNHRVEELRFFSEKLRDDERYKRAAATRTIIKVHVKFDQQSLGELWLPGGSEVIRCRNVSSDDYLILHGTLADLAQHREAEAVYRAEHQQTRDQASAAKAAGRAATTTAAAAEQKQQQGGIRTPKSEKHGDLRPNAAAEQSVIESAGLTPTNTSARARPSPAPLNTPPVSCVGEEDSAAAKAVARFVRSLSDKGAPHDEG